MPRRDISDKAVHFTSGADWNEAFGRLQSIVFEGKLRGSAEKIRGGYKCICFTEAPLTSLNDGLVNPDAFSRYTPFGVIFEKSWLLARGARPVIYEPDAEFDILPDEMKWRHVRYEPPAVDFTWEREWRIRSDELSLDPDCAGLVLPDGEWADRLFDQHNREQDYRVQEYASVMDENLAEMGRDPFPWRVFLLR